MPTLFSGQSPKWSRLKDAIIKGTITYAEAQSYYTFDQSCIDDLKLVRLSQLNELINDANGGPGGPNPFTLAWPV